MSGRQALTALCGHYPVFAPGEVWLVGAGPGDPGLLTLDALAGLLQADVVVHDALVDARVLALARSGAQILFAGKRGGRRTLSRHPGSDGRSQRIGERMHSGDDARRQSGDHPGHGSRSR